MNARIFADTARGINTPDFYVRNSTGAQCEPFRTYAKAQDAVNAIESGTRDICEGCAALTDRPLVETPDDVFLCQECAAENRRAAK